MRDVAAAAADDAPHSTSLPIKRIVFSLQVAEAINSRAGHMSALGPNEFRCDGRFYALFNLPSNASEDDIR